MDEDVCRVCRTESSVDHPLFYPCKCSGSIRYVHQDCLTKWLKHSGKTKCELCNHSFSFSPRLVKIGLRAMLVGSVWLICLPYFTVWVWRFYFWSGEYIAYRINGQYPPFRAENGINNSTREENPFSILYLKIAKGLLWYLPPEVENIIKEFGEFTRLVDHSLDINSINLDDELKIKEAIGLSASRQWYLYDQIRDLVQNPNKRNNICPKPSVPRH
ncbi:1689_t:CDS:2 [Entrophospora sp. SA101]|nr:1689_t:CDS:2 [Entrophospora sp. SA101]